MMNYFEIFNKVMLELNLRPIEQFENIYKNEHLRILENISRVNCEVLSSSEWDFLFRTEEITLEADEIDPCWEIPGRIFDVIENGQKLNYHKNFGDFYTNTAPSGSYGLCNGKLLFPKSRIEREFQVLYFTKNTVCDKFGCEKINFNAKEDISLLPMSFAVDILVYGACIKTKANPTFAKFGYWNSAYIKALSQLRSLKPGCVKDFAEIKLARRKNQ